MENQVSIRALAATLLALAAPVAGLGVPQQAVGEEPGSELSRKRAYQPLSPSEAQAKRLILQETCRDPKAADDAPNVVVIFVDDLGYADLGLHGSTEIPTPRIDALARSGVRFSNAYVTAATCAPSRAGLLTGRYQQRFGFEFNIAGLGTRPGRERVRGRGLDPAVITLADVLRECGYVTGIMGKWHLGIEAHFQPAQRGFDEFFGFLTGSHRYIHTTPGNPCGVYRKGIPIRDHDYLTTAIARASVRFIEDHRERPFFLYVPFNAVHVPLEAPLEYRERFASGSKDRNTYYGMVTAMDEAVGMILDALHANELDEETIVIFMNDNGAPERTEVQSNAPFRLGKFYLFEGGVRVPMFVRWPGVARPGTTFDGLVSALDLFPTICAAAEVQLPTAVRPDGVDLAPFLRGEREGEPHGALFWRIGANAAVRDTRWKLIRSRESVWLFDLASDPGEQQNLFDDEPDVAAGLQALLAGWEAELRAPAWPAMLNGSTSIDGMPYELYQ